MPKLSFFYGRPTILSCFKQFNCVRIFFFNGVLKKGGHRSHFRDSLKELQEEHKMTITMYIQQCRKVKKWQTHADKIFKQKYKLKSI